jgi:uncharacterized protein
MKPSRYNHIIRRRNQPQLLYNSWHHEFLELDNAQSAIYGGLSLPITYNLFNQKDPPVAQLMSELTLKGFMIEDSIDEIKQIEILSHLYRFDPGRLNLWICPTTRCDQGCPSCPYTTNPSELSPESWDKVFRMISARAPGLKTLTVNWWGGEPSLAKRDLTSFTSRISELSLKFGFDYSCRTIGNVLTDYPGLPPKNERWFNLDALDKNDQPDENTVLLATIRQATGYIDRLPRGTRIRIIKENPGSKLCRNVNQLCQSAPNMEDEELESVQILLDHAFKVENLPLPKMVACQAVDPQSFIMDVSGNVYKCWNDVGYPENAIPEGNNDPLDIRNFRWLNWDPYHEAHCRLCNILPWCLGGCRAKPPDDDCSMWHYSLREMLSLAAAANKNGA